MNVQTLKDIGKTLKVGDVVWTKHKITNIDPNTEKFGGDRYFTCERPFQDCFLDSPTYGDVEAILGDINNNDLAVITRNVEVPKEIVKEVKTTDQKALGMVEAYEKILFSNKKITVE